MYLWWIVIDFLYIQLYIIILMIINLYNKIFNYNTKMQPKYYISKKFKKSCFIYYKYDIYYIYENIIYMYSSYKNCDCKFFLIKPNIIQEQHLYSGIKTYHYINGLKIIYRNDTKEFNYNRENAKIIFYKNKIISSIRIIYYKYIYNLKFNYKNNNIYIKNISLTINKSNIIYYQHYQYKLFIFD